MSPGRRRLLVGLWHVRAQARRVWRATGIFGQRRLVRPLLFPAGLLLVGTVGYPLIEGPPWTPFDGLYMTAITLCTIGYGETHPLSTAGRVFTIFLAFGGIFTLGYFATEVIRAVVSGELQDLLGRQRMEEELAALSGHTVVCGFGRMGRIVCDELDRQGERFVVIDTAPPAGGWGYRHGVRLQGNATEDEVLRRAGADRAKVRSPPSGRTPTTCTSPSAPGCSTRSCASSPGRKRNKPRVSCGRSGRRRSSPRTWPADTGRSRLCYGRPFSN